MKTLFIAEKRYYSGSELAPHWIYKNYGLLGDAVVAFIGEVNVPQDHMLDISEAQDQSFIYSPLMLSFIVEHFDHDLSRAIFRQRMFLVCVKEVLEQLDIKVTRRGDNLFVGRDKLSVSIATVTSISTLIHVGLNIETRGTPVKTCGLRELGVVDIQSFAESVMLRYSVEMEQIYEVRCKVRSV